MARRGAREPLTIYANGELVGTWELGVRGEHVLRYARSWTESARGRPLSLSLPFLPGNRFHRGEAVQAYFENLLPDSVEILRRVQARFGAPSIGAFDLLREIGRDCVGAVQVLPTDEPVPDVRSIAGSALAESDVAALLRRTASSPGLVLPDRDDFRISIAGAQEKTALLYHNEQWMLPRGTTPSTHIFKPALGRVSDFNADLSSSPENEWLCNRILDAFGLPVPESVVAQYEDRRALVVTRFDRLLSTDGTWIVRLPVEDFCQATSTPPSRKYESDGGPGILTVMGILGASRVPSDRATFLTAQILMWMLGAPDAHAKNFSIFLEPGGSFRLAPVYDVLSAWPVLGHGPDRIPIQRLRMAMAVTGKNRHYRWDAIAARHWIETARRHGVSTPTTVGIMERLIERTESAIDRAITELPTDFPEPTASAIFQGLRSSAERLRKSQI
ncbi:MAG: type II toxin-antitoxin system HipA family toxin [Spirochaetaceae bacterium]|nr:MAG: type II toxin-antitoxin system HipA family toxin [Spirochaetaceae bacterium]